MSDDAFELRVAWRTHVGGHEGVLDAVLARHREPHRRYHTVDHVVWVDRHVRTLLRDDDRASGLESGTVAALHVAAVFHDAVYEPTASTPHNETASARLARAELTDIGWEPDRIDQVVALIEATAEHRPSDDLATAVLCDADLAILGADPRGYRTYVDQVRVEYGHVSEPDWRTGRATVLHDFLDRDRIFTTETGHERWENRARANLAAELATLV